MRCKACRVDQPGGTGRTRFCCVARKKAPEGIATPTPAPDLIVAQLKAAEARAKGQVP